MRVAVVGGAGYVGSVLCNRLAALGHVVVCYDNLMYGQPGSRFQPFPIDARYCTPDWFEGCDAVVNLAGFSNDPTAQMDPVRNWESNTAMAVRIAHCACSAGVRRLVYASSASIYQSSEQMHYDADVTESCPVGPVWHYSRSKFAGELATLSFAGDMCCTVLRKGTVCGPSPRMRWDLMLNTMFRSAMTSGKIILHGGGHCYRPLLGINDAAGAYIDVLQAPEAAVSGRIFNVSGQNEQVKDYADAVRCILRIHGAEVAVQDGPQTQVVRSYRVSSRALREALGWVPEETAHTISDDLVAYRHCEYPSREHPYPLLEFDDPKGENIRCILGEGKCA